MDGIRVAVVGATGLVGQEMIRVLEQRNFPVRELVPLGSERSYGEAVQFRGKEVAVDLLTDEVFTRRPVDVALFSPGSDVSRKYAPIAAKSGALVIDNTSCFRMDPDVPLVVPEVNRGAIAQFGRRRIIANPNCSTIQMVLPLKALHDEYGLKRVIVSTYQGVAGAGRKGIEALSKETVSLLRQEEPEEKHFPHWIAFNCIPQIGEFDRDGYCEEELKMIHETRKILELPSLRVTATTVRVPLFYGHSESVTVELNQAFEVEEARAVMARFPGISLVDDPRHSTYPMPMTAAEKDEVFVGRVRRDHSAENGLNLWIVADNVRKGAALNAVQIAETWLSEYASF